MAIIPPTVERVEEFLKYTDYAPHEEIAVLPLANLRATPWNIAVNAVMAGARPEYMPIIIAAVQAIGDPAFRLAVTGGSTHSFSTFYWVNGPLARQLGIDYGQGLIAAPSQCSHRPYHEPDREEHSRFQNKRNPDGELREVAILGPGGR